MMTVEMLQSKQSVGHVHRYRWFLRGHRCLLWVVLISLVFKTILAAIDGVINPDGVLYIAAAQQFAIGNFSEALKLYPMPAFPLMITMVQMVIPDWVAAARVITITAMVLASIPLYGITARLFNQRAAFWAALFLAVTPEANENALRVIRDPIFLLLVLLTVYFIIRGMQSKQMQWIVTAFLFASGSLLFRIEGIVILAMPVFIFLLFSSINKNSNMKRFMRKCAVFWIGVPLSAGLITALLFGPNFVIQNRIDQLVQEILALIKFSAFEKYIQIYAFFKDIHNEPPFSGFSHSLPATIRHWMPIIYGIGLIESLVKQLYPIFLLPLLINLKNRHGLSKEVTVEKLSICIFFFGYMLLLYYFLITRDRMVGRLLFTPAIFLYPWVGQGFTIFLDGLKNMRFSRYIQVALVIVFIAVPFSKSARAVINSDRGIIDAGHVIYNDESLRNQKILFSDTRYFLYSQNLDKFIKTSKTSYIIGHYLKTGRIAEIEDLALEEEAAILVLFLNKKNRHQIIAFDRYTEYRRIDGKKGTTVIYRTK
jgi:4-amino-4-deoxy-L-arabinose transferase-like glycosyltransferase